MFCKKCGAALSNSDIFCPECGASTASSQNNNGNIIDVSDSVLDLTHMNNSMPITPKKNNKPLFISLAIAGGVLLIAIIVAIVFFATSNSADKADKYFADGEYEKAAQMYEKILEKNDEDTDVRISLAKSYMKLKEYDDAIETLDYVFSYDDGDSEVYELILSACEKENENERANEYYYSARSQGISVNLENTGYVEVPDFVDLSLKSAEKYDDITVIERDRVNDDSKEGTILYQEPEAGIIIKSDNAKVYVVVSDGPAEAIMKDYSGRSIAYAKKDLGDDYDIDTEEESSSTVAKGQIIRTVPAAGETVKKGEEVTIYVSSGEKIVSVPKITGKTLDKADDLLDSVELEIGEVTYINSTKERGTIVKQNPEYKDKVKANTYVDVVVSIGE